MRRPTRATPASGFVAFVGLAAAASLLGQMDPCGPHWTPPSPLPPASMVMPGAPESDEPGAPVAGPHGSVLTIEQAQARARQIAAELITVKNADGSETLIHDGRLADYSVVRIGPDGRMVFGCVHGELGVSGALHGPVPALEEE